MLISDDRFFEEELDESFAGLQGIGELYRREGLKAAEQRLAQVVRAQEYLERIPKLGQAVVGGFDDDFSEAEASDMQEG